MNSIEITCKGLDIEVRDMDLKGAIEVADKIERAINALIAELNTRPIRPIESYMIPQDTE